jgi:membrane-associated phospholipid phosphatase
LYHPCGSRIEDRHRAVAEVTVASRRRDLAKRRLPAGTSSKGPLRSRAGSPLPAATWTVAVGFVGLVVCLVVLGSLAEGVRDQEVFALDTVATPFLHALASPALDALMQAATFAGSNLVIPPLFVLAVVWLMAIRRRREALFLAIASGGSLALNETMKVFFQRARPELSYAQVLPDYSFPSGHTMNSLVFYVGLAIVLWSVRGRRTGLVALTIAIALSLLIGVSRIYLGYHYFTDVLGGLLAGAGWLLVVGAAFQTGPLWRLWRDHRPTDPTDGNAPSEALR